jgi:quercetin dioxygenase-like cupin family protein
LLIDGGGAPAGLVARRAAPPGFRGEEHAAFANELAYVLGGEFTVTTRGRGRRVVHKGEVEYASKGTVHASSNDGVIPTLVLVVVLKDQ